MNARQKLPDQIRCRFMNASAVSRLMFLFILSATAFPLGCTVMWLRT